MTTTETKKTPNELQLAEGPSKNYETADLATQPTANVKCPSWCREHVRGEDAFIHAQKVEAHADQIYVTVTQFMDEGDCKVELIDNSDGELTPEEARNVATALLKAADIAEGVQPTAGLTVQSDENALHVTLPDWLTPEQRHELELSIEVFMAAAVDVLRSRGSES